MELTKTELETLAEIARGNVKIKEIAIALKKSKSQIYRIAKNLEKKNFIELSKTEIHAKKQTHVSLLIQIIKNNKKIQEVLSNSGINILSAIQTPKKIGKIVFETKLKKAIIYKKLREAMSISAVKKTGKYFEINDKVWSELKEFLAELSKYEETIDPRVPAEAMIYFKNNNEILYSSINEQNAVNTAFSAFQDYGIKLLGRENFYYLPKKILSLKEIFLHSLIISEKRKEIRFYIYASLFYLKFKNKLIRIKHPVLDSIKEVLKGKAINDYPSLSEIKDKAQIYDIRI